MNQRTNTFSNFYITFYGKGMYEKCLFKKRFVKLEAINLIVDISVTMSHFQLKTAKCLYCFKKCCKSQLCKKSSIAVFHKIMVV